MKTRSVWFAFGAAALSLSLACGGSQTAPDNGPKPAPDDFKRYDAKTFHETVSSFGGSFSADEQRILLTSDVTGIYNVYSQPIAGGPPTALTKSTKESIRGVSYFPHDDRFLFMSDAGGNELDHVWVMETSGEKRDLTPGDKLKASFLGWSGDRKNFWVMTNERNPKAFDLYRYATDGYARELAFENPGDYLLGGVSRDGRWLALGKARTNADSDVHVVDLGADGTEPLHVTPHEGDVEHGVAGFSPDSKILYYTTNGHGEFRQVWAYDLAAKTRAADEVADWDVSYSYFSETGKYKVVATNADARTLLRVVESATGQPVEMPALPGGDIKGVGFSRSETKMVMAVSSDRAPSDLYVYDIAAASHRRLTTSLNPTIDEKHLVDGQVVRYKSFDGLDIPAILYRPVQASAATKVPALVWVHGGPGGQSRVGYRAMLQHLVNQGYAILAVNNRGSSGYGKTFNHLDDRSHGEGDLKDCVWGHKYLAGLDWVAADKIGIIGGSYGGYMVLAALAFEPEVFAVGVDIFGVANWIRTIESMPAWWGAFRDALIAEIGDPATDRERLTRISPLFHAGNIVRPLLVIQGANDPRVIQIESDEIVAAVKKNGVPVEYLVFPDEGHGFRKKANRISASSSIAAFLEQHLR